MLRRPQDVHASNDQPPPLAGYRKSAEDYAARYERALARGKDAAACDALWGLVAHGTESVAWCEAALRSGDDLKISDAAGVCAWIGPPPALIETLRNLVETLPDSEGRDSAAAAVPVEVRAEMTREEDDAAPDVAPGDNLLCKIVWYVEAPLERVVADHEQWFAGREAPEPATRHSAPLVELGPLLDWSAEIPWRRPFLMVSAGDRWTAVFSRTADHSWVDSFSRRLNTRVLHELQLRESLSRVGVLAHPAGRRGVPLDPGRQGRLGLVLAPPWARAGLRGARALPGAAQGQALRRRDARSVLPGSRDRPNQPGFLRSRRRPLRGAIQAAATLVAVAELEGDSRSPRRWGNEWGNMPHRSQPIPT